MNQQAEIWRRLAERGYREKEGNSTKVEVLELIRSTVFQVRFNLPGTGVGDIQDDYETVLARIALLPRRVA